MDMLSFSKDREPALEPSDLNETVGDVVELMQSRAGELGVSAASGQPCQAMPRVMVDPDGIHRAVLNIVTNAIDATEGHRGRPGDRRRPSGTPRPRWRRIRIADNGVGIDEAEIDSIFQIFASSKGSRGTGLGLPVSQKIIREHGGTIALSSQPGQARHIPDRIAHDAEIRPQGDGRRADHDGLNACAAPQQSCQTPPSATRTRARRVLSAGSFFVPQFLNSRDLVSFNSFFMQLRGPFRGSSLYESCARSQPRKRPREESDGGSHPGRLHPALLGQFTGVHPDERESSHPLSLEPSAGRFQGWPAGADGHACASSFEIIPTVGRPGKSWAPRLIDLGRHAEAEGALKRAIALCPPEKVWIPLAEMGHLQKSRGEFWGAAAWYGQAIKSVPDEAGGHIGLGGILARFGRLQEAENAHRAATRCTKGRLDEAYLNLGLVLRAEQRDEEAASCLEQALRLDPKYAAARKAPARCPRDDPISQEVSPGTRFRQGRYLAGSRRAHRS